MIIYGALVPHPPIMVEGIGRPEDLAQIEATRGALAEIDRNLGAAPPESLVVFTPHGTLYQDALVVYDEPVLRGDLSRFGLEHTWQWESDRELAETIASLSQEQDLPVYLTSQIRSLGRRQLELDHGVLAPFSFFNPNWSEQVKLVVIPLGYLPLEELYRFGMVIRDAALKLERRVAVIASGDLSHCLKPEAPAGYDPRGAEFDQKLIDLIKKQAISAFFDLDPVLVEKAAECGFRSLIMLLGTMDQSDFRAQVLSYEGPFGVGYAVASFQMGESRPSLLPKLQEKRETAVRKRRGAESPLVKYARQVVEAYVNDIGLPEPEHLEEFARERAGAFVSIKKRGELRGCIGTTEPTQTDVTAEVRRNAIAAASQDPRFSPISPEELPDLVFSVDLLQPAEPIKGLEELDPERYGVIVRNGWRQGLLLPKLEGVETAAEQVAIAKRKAGIGSEEPVEMQRFEVVRYY